MTLSKESARLGVVLRDGRDVRVAFVRHEDHPGLQAMHLVGLALGDHHEATRHQRLARALVARHVEDGARLDVELALLNKFGNSRTPVASRNVSCHSWRPSPYWRPFFRPSWAVWRETFVPGLKCTRECKI